MTWMFFLGSRYFHDRMAPTAGMAEMVLKWNQPKKKGKSLGEQEKKDNKDVTNFTL
jgi:hypothetical protein